MTDANGHTTSYGYDAAELRVGERVQGRAGPLVVAGLVRRPGPEVVWNLEVDGDHCSRPGRGRFFFPVGLERPSTVVLGCKE